jgi:kynurenine formamidase
MAAIGRASIVVVILAALSMFSLHKDHNDSTPEGIPARKARILDLSYGINDKLVPWPGDEKFFEAKVNATIEKNGYFTRSFWMLEHYGTHLDAPAHFAPGKATVDQIPVKQLFGAAVVIDVRAESSKDADYQLPAARIEDFEKKYGRIPEGAIVLLRTGWASRWPDVQKYRNQDAKGKMHFPGFSVEAAKALISRKVSGLGCDTLSIDYGASEDFAVHHVSLGAGLYHLENLADLSELPEASASLIVAPIKLQGGSGGAARVFAIIP